MDIGQSLSGIPMRRGDLPSYKRDAAAYLTSLEFALPAKRAFDCGAVVDLTFSIRNAGMVPAEDLRITLAFPAGSFAIDPDIENERLFFSPGNGISIIDGVFGLPESPREPWTPRQEFIGPLTQRQVSPPVPQPRGPISLTPEWNSVVYRHPKLLQKDGWLLPPVRVYLPPTVGGGIQVTYVLRADNLPEPVQGIFALRAQ
jgi:hypothetical protein